MSCTVHMRRLNLSDDDIHKGISSRWTTETRSAKFYNDGNNIELTKAQFDRVVSDLSGAFRDRPGPNGMKSHSWRPGRDRFNAGESSIDVTSSSFTFEEIERRVARAIKTALK